MHEPRAPVAVAAVLGTNLTTRSTTTAPLTNLALSIIPAVPTNDGPGPNTTLGVIHAPTAPTHNLPGHNIAPGVNVATTMDDFTYNFDHSGYNFDFSSAMNFPTLGNPSANNVFLGGSGGFTDSCGMQPLLYPFPPVVHYSIPPAHQSLSQDMSGDLYQMPPIPNSYGAYETNPHDGPDSPTTPTTRMRTPHLSLQAARRLRTAAATFVLPMNIFFS
ncbi:hypothetical protein DFH07DRAFT_962034 [Mycena maculata]|uniref:Uncharacterized protein n=1 Tax=Mycena maculata TaxID=230809 RepID=A0AAD7IUB2_9AGAR|nr:hypothetical protein DFH07DRAFT_962034 [Mycena maculata]